MLVAVLVAAAWGVLLSGYVSAIPVLTRGTAFTLGPLQLGWMRNWSQVRAVGWTEWLSIGLFAIIFLGSLAGQRFWCRYVCPSGAVFSLLRSGAKIRPAFGPPVSGDACVALGRRFCVLQRQRGASPAANQDAGLICAPILTGYCRRFGEACRMICQTRVPAPRSVGYPMASVEEE